MVTGINNERGAMQPDLFSNPPQTPPVRRYAWGVDGHGRTVVCLDKGRYGIATATGSVWDLLDALEQQDADLGADTEYLDEPS